MIIFTALLRVMPTSILSAVLSCALNMDFSFLACASMIVSSLDLNFLYGIFGWQLSHKPPFNLVSNQYNPHLGHFSLFMIEVLPYQTPISLMLLFFLLMKGFPTGRPLFLPCKNRSPRYPPH